MIKDLVASLNNVTRVDRLRRLVEVMDPKDREFKDMYNCGKMILEYHMAYGVMPASVDVTKKFPDFAGGNVVVNADELIDRVLIGVREVKTRRDLMRLAADPTITPDRLDKIKAGMERVSQAKFLSIQEMAGKDDYLKIKARPVGMKWFIDVLDEEISGTSYGTITVLFGFIGSLKTTTALSMVYANAKDLGYNSAFITLEVPKREVYFNLLSRHALTVDASTKITAKRIKKALLTEEEEKFLWEEVEPSFRQLPGKIYILDRGDICDCVTGNMTEESFLEALRLVDKECGGLDAFVVDYVNLMKYFASSNAAEKGVNAFVGFLNDVVIKFNERGLIGIVVAQGNREGWKKACRRGGRYSIDALAEFNQLEQSAYYVVSLFLDEALKSAGEVKAQLLKHRAGNAIEEPFTTLIMPENFFVGDNQEYKKAYTESSLDGVLLD